MNWLIVIMLKNEAITLRDLKILWFYLVIYFTRKLNFTKLSQYLHNKFKHSIRLKRFENLIKEFLLRYISDIYITMMSPCTLWPQDMPAKVQAESDQDSGRKIIATIYVLFYHSYIVVSHTFDIHEEWR